MTKAIIKLNNIIGKGQYQAVLRKFNYSPSQEIVTFRNFYYNELKDVIGFRNFSNISFDLVIDQFNNTNKKAKNFSIQFQRLLNRSSPCIFLFSKDTEIYAINPRFENIITKVTNTNGKVVNLFKPKHEWFVKKDNQKY